jgi:PIN domain nuclease of toxin-antitoxin system
MKYILDTHALIWFLEGSTRLGANANAILSEATNELVLPAIALAEAVWIISRGKTSISSVETLLQIVNLDPRVVIHPLDQTVIEKTIQLSTINEMHDRQIVATALVIQAQGEKVALLTCDQNITAANLIPIVW